MIVTVKVAVNVWADAIKGFLLLDEKLEISIESAGHPIIPATRFCEIFTLFAMALAETNNIESNSNSFILIQTLG